jgi:TATA-box binding protein (TBP) (component of TFIID and TFIIIB)
MELINAEINKINDERLNFGEISKITFRFKINCDIDVKHLDKTNRLKTSQKYGFYNCHEFQVNDYKCNCRVFTNGSFQITHCKNFNDIQNIILEIFDILNKCNENVHDKLTTDNLINVKIVLFVISNIKQSGYFINENIMSEDNLIKYHNKNFLVVLGTPTSKVNQFYESNKTTNTKMN